jgi:hypothetical protein
MRFTGLLPPDLDNIRDRFDNVEGLSGWDKPDILRGDSPDPADLVDHELTRPGLIGGLTELIGGEAEAPFSNGNILLGGASGDLLEGRGGNDIIDGDAWLKVRISVRDANNPDQEIRSVDSMKDIQADVFAGTIKPSQLRVVREILTPAPAGAVDTAVFSDVRANYDIVQNPDDNTKLTITHARGTATDGTDTLRNVERLTFADQTVEVNPLLTNTPATGTVSVSDTTPAENQELTASQAISDLDGVGDPVTFAWQMEEDPGTNVWTTVALDDSFTPGDEEVGLRLRVVATFQDGDDVLESVNSAPTQAVANVNDEPTGRPAISDTTPREGDAVTASRGSILDNDGLDAATFTYQWQQEIGATFSNIAGAVNATFTPGSDQVGRRLRVVASFTDDNNRNETATSNPTTEVSEAPAPPPAPPAGDGDGGGGGGQQNPLRAPAGSSLVDPVAVLPGAGRGGEPSAATTTVGALSVSTGVTARSTAPITVSATVPADGDVVRIRVFRLGTGGAAKASKARGKWIATVYRKTPKAKRYTFRLTEGPLKRLKPGRYLVEVRVGRSRSDLGPAKSKTVTIKAKGFASP